MRVSLLTTAFVSLFLAVASVGGRTPAADPNRVVIVVVGAPGTADYEQQFTTWANDWQQACEEAGAAFVPVGLDEDTRVSDRETLERILRERGGQPDTKLWLVLIGHGTFDGRTARFNLRGPDVSAADLAQWLRPLEGPVAVINTASSSAPFLKELAAPGRVVVTATKSGFEQNFARFGGYLAESIVNPDADLDKDGQVSLLEAFLKASHAVEEFYKSAGRLATEHALLDDNGDGLGTPADWFRGIRPTRKPADGKSLDGYRAHQFHLLRSPLEEAMPPTLRARRDELELQVIQLRERKESLPEEEYLTRLEALLTEIARIYEQVETPVASGSAP